MELIHIKTPKHLEVFEKDWNAILKESNNDNPFIEYRFIYNWWRFIGLQEEVEIYAVKEHKRIIAFFPFQVKRMHFGFMVQFMALNVASYMDFIVKKVDKNRSIMFAMDEIIKLKKRIVFYLHGFIESSETLSSLSDYLLARNLKVRYYRIGIPPFDLENISKLDTSLDYELSNIVKNVAFDHTRKMIFSTNTIKAKKYRDFLWLREWTLSKILPKIKVGKR